METIVSSKYPMSTDIIEDYDSEFNDNDVVRSKKLAKVKSGSGHDCFLKGIIVQYDLTAPAYFWPQFQRYHFHDIISSQSKMHKITKMNIDTQCNMWVLPQVKEFVKDLIKAYNYHEDCVIYGGQKYNKKDFYHILISNLPQGLNLTARITSNYLQLKTIVSQRKNHKLYDWSIDFMDWVKSLPKYEELINNLND